MEAAVDTAECYALLQRVRTQEWHAVFSAALLDEWQRHETQISIGWLFNMRKRRRICELEPHINADLRRVINAHSDAGIVRLLLKDAHLVEAAIVSDAPIISNDEKARRQYRHIAQESYPPIGNIVWFNPSRDTAAFNPPLIDQSLKLQY